MKPETMMIDDVRYIRADKAVEPCGEIKIVILQRGWVMVGRLERDGNDCKLHNASVIRIWGTTKGIGQIAGHHPQGQCTGHSGAEIAQGGQTDQQREQGGAGQRRVRRTVVYPTDAISDQRVFCGVRGRRHADRNI